MEDDELIFTEEDSLPLEFFCYVPEAVLMEAVHKETYYLTAQLRGDKCGVAIFFLAPDHSGAVLSHIYVKMGYRNMGIASALLKTAHENLTNIDCNDMVCFAYDSDVDTMNGLLGKCGFLKECDGALRLTFDYEAAEAAASKTREDEPEIGYLTDEAYITEESAQTADILRSMGIPFMCHEEKNGAGRFVINDIGELRAVMLGRYNFRGDMMLTAYYDDSEGKNTTVYLNLLFEEIISFVRNSTFNNTVSIVCMNDLQREIAEALLGTDEKAEAAAEFRLVTD